MANNPMLKNISRGALGGGLLAFGLFGLWYFAAANGPVLKGGEAGESNDELSILYVLVPGLIGLFSGAVLGFVAHRAENYRLLKLSGTAAGLYLIAAWLCSASLVFAIFFAGSYSGDEGPLLDSIKFAFAGAIMLSPICVPLIGLLVFGLERWTRRR